MSPELHLASSSPRRSDILRSLGLTFSSAATDIDESALPGESAEVLVERLAVAKARAADVAMDTIVLGSDTVVVLDDTVMGKPGDKDEAVKMLLNLSARSHQVITGVALLSSSGVQTALSRTTVRFRDIDRDEAVRYWHSGEPRDKAGGYGIQGLGGAFVCGIQGSYSGVMGLPVFETVALLKAAGVDVLK